MLLNKKVARVCYKPTLCQVHTGDKVKCCDFQHSGDKNQQRMSNGPVDSS